MPIYLTEKSSCSKFMAEKAGKMEFLQLARRLWNDWEVVSGSSHLQLYVHIGYCLNRCSFCTYASRIMTGKEDIDKLLEQLGQEMNWYRSQFSGRTFDALYIGGGTPSLLSSDQIVKLMTNLSGTFNIVSDNGNEKSFEASPASLDGLKIEALRSVGINRISLGIQSLDPEVQMRNNRLNPSIQDCIHLLNEVLRAGFLEVNVDLMAGIPGRTRDNLKSDFKILSDAGCDLITIYIDMRIYRNPKRKHERLRLLEDIHRLAEYNQDYVVNGGKGYNEYNTFIRGNAYNPSLTVRYITNLNKPNVFCLGLGEFARSCTSKYVFHYQRGE